MVCLGLLSDHIVRVCHLSWASVVPMPQLFGLWLYWMCMFYTPSQRGNRRDVLKRRAASAVLDLSRILRVQQVVPDWICRRARKSLCAEEGPLPVPHRSGKVGKRFLAVVFLPCFNLFFPLRYKKEFKTEIADVYISAVVLWLPFQNKTFSKLL